MAQPISYAKAPNDGDVLLEMVEPSFHAKGSKPKGLYLEDAGPNKKIDYVLVYERCQEKDGVRHLQTADCRLADYISCYLYEYMLYIPIPLSIPIPIPIYLYLYEALVWLTEVLVWLTQARVCKSAVCKCRTPGKRK